MQRLLGVLVMVLFIYGLLMAVNETARSVGNHKDLAQRLGFYGVLTLAVGVLIVSGGIDLSIGSVISLGAVGFALLLLRGWSPWLAAPAVVACGAGIGLVHGLLVTYLRLQPFLVTLCGLFVYRGLARWLSPAGSVGWPSAPAESQSAIADLRWLLYSGEPLGVPNQLLLLLLLTVLLSLFLHGTVYGRYFYAIGYNEEAARYAGIATNRYKVLAYVLCSAMAGLGSVLYLLNYDTATPTSAGAFLELYAITGAVLGGCSLRGGEGSVPGMLLGAAVLPLLRSLCRFGGITDELEYAVIGTALLLGTVADELLKRRGMGGK